MWHNLVIGLALAVSVAAAVKPLRLGRIRLDMVTVPPIVLGLVMLTGTVDGPTAAEALTGTANLRPWEILVIFYTVAYVSISVDLSGILDWFAFRLVRRAWGRPRVLFWFFYAFASVLTVFTSNDIVILTLTPIIFYLRKHADLDVTPLLFAEFFGANTLSMLLYIGNPTNIILGNALGLSFLAYTRIMAIPTLVATVANGLLLRVLFRRRLGGRFVLRENTQARIRSLWDARIATGLLLAMLGLLMFSQYLGLPIWVVTLAFFLIYVVEDLGIFAFHILRDPRRYFTELSRDLKSVYSLWGFATERHDLFAIVRRMPWKILPFVTVVFVLVHGWQVHGFIPWLAQALSGLSDGLAASVFVNGGLAFLASNLMNNQPAAILFANVLSHPNFAAGAPGLAGATYAVVIAANLGANLTLMGALAGLMWQKILATKGVHIGYGAFARRGVVITPVVFALSLGALWLVLTAMG